MAGIYIHIPFCRQACHYCNFYFSTSLQQRQPLVQALLQEIASTRHYAARPTIETIYFGGGTPSLLPMAYITAILTAISKRFTVVPGAEITLEANPDDITAAVLQDWQQAGINRLSIGIQSFLAEELVWMNRAHNAEQATNCIRLAREAGFNNFSVDLIYGSPLLSDADWRSNVEKLLEAAVPHISCYALTVEQGTALGWQVAQQKQPPMDAEKQARHFEQLMDWLGRAGYEHYEISNFALPGWRSRHNSSYWKGLPYYGFGPSAHAFDGERIRRWNMANTATYIKTLAEGMPPSESETLSPLQQLNEYTMISLRTMEGLDLQTVIERFGETYKTTLLQAAQPFIATQKIIHHNNQLVLSNAGKLFADGIAAELFFTE